MSQEFTPTLYLKKECPFCFKLRLALLEAGMLDGVHIREFASGTPEEKAIKDDLSSKLDRVSFPAAEVAPGDYRKDSDKLIAHFTGLKQIDPQELVTLQAYIEGPFNELQRLFKENRDLKQASRVRG